MEPPWIVPGILGYYVFQDSGIPPMGFLTSEYLVSQESWDLHMSGYNPCTHFFSSGTHVLYSHQSSLQSSHLFEDHSYLDRLDSPTHLVNLLQQVLI